jgi:hypothetical protein
MHKEYYQIYENNHPVIDANFETMKGARDYLKNIARLVEASDTDFYFSRYQRRLAHIPLRDILWLKRLYADGHEEKVTFVIRVVRLSPYTNII